MSAGGIELYTSQYIVSTHKTLYIPIDTVKSMFYSAIILPPFNVNVMPIITFPALLRNNSASTGSSGSQALPPLEYRVLCLRSGKSIYRIYMVLILLGGKSCSVSYLYLWLTYLPVAMCQF